MTHFLMLWSTTLHKQNSGYYSNHLQIIEHVLSYMRVGNVLIIVGFKHKLVNLYLLIYAGNHNLLIN